MQNPYEILGVEPDASEKEIKAAFRREAMKHHPDRGGDPKAFKEAKDAYDLLMDKDSRETFDTYGADGVNERREVRAMAEAMVTQGYMELLQQHGFRPLDYKRELQEHIAKNKASTVHRKVRLKDEVSRLEYLLAHTTGDLIVQQMEAVLHSKKEELSHLEKIIKTMDLAFHLASSIQYTGEKERSAGPHFHWNTSPHGFGGNGFV